MKKETFTIPAGNAIKINLKEAERFSKIKNTGNVMKMEPGSNNCQNI